LFEKQQECRRFVRRTTSNAMAPNKKQLISVAWEWHPPGVMKQDPKNLPSH
jgi:hypothetical protein